MQYNIKTLSKLFDHNDVLISVKGIVNISKGSDYADEQVQVAW